MAEQNPIKYSDLISPDSSIEDLIGLLERLNTTYTGVVNSVKTQASTLASSLKAVSGATESGRNATKAASEEAQRLHNAYKQLDAAMSSNAQWITKIKEITREQNQYNKNMVKLGGEEIKTREQITQATYNQLSAQYSLNKAYINNLSAEEREIKVNKDLIDTTKEIYEQMKRLQEATGKYTLNVGNYENAITQAIGVNTRWYQGIQQIGALFEGGFTKGLQTAGSAVAGLGRKLLALLANPIVLTITGITAAFMALSKGISTSEENTHTLMRILAPFQRVLTGLLNVLQNVTGLILKSVEGAEKLAMAFSRLAEKLPVVGSQFKKVNDELRKNIEFTIRKQKLEKEQRQSEEKVALIERNIAKFKADAAKTDDPVRRATLAKMALREEERLEHEKWRLAKEDVAIKEKEARDAHNDAEANEALSKARAKLYQIEADMYNKKIRLHKQLRKAEEDMNKSGGSGGGKNTNKDTEIDLEKQKLEETRKLEDMRISLIEDANLRERFTIIANYERRIEDLKGSEQYITEMTVLLTRQRDEKLAALFEKEAKEQQDREKRDLEARLKATDEMIKQQKQREKDIEAEEMEMRQRRKEAMADALNYSLDNLNAYMDAWVQAAEKRLAYYEKEVDAAKKTLESEIEARNNGYAANVALAQKELDQARKNQQKALREQQRAQKAQEMLDTATQVSSLVTATANIWSAFTKAGPWGIAAAIAATALMFGSFAAAKIKAASISGIGGGEEQYGEGTVELLQGGSHQSGNDIDLGRKKDGTRRRAEGGEYFAVINRRSSRRYRSLIPDVIHALNDGTFAQKYQRAYGDGGIQVSVNSQSPDLRNLSSDVRLIREQGEQSVTYDHNGNEVMRYKNLRRIIKN